MTHVFRRIGEVALLAAFVYLSSTVLWGQSQWVHFDQAGKLVYAKTDRGDRIPDFSSCGYKGGGIALPRVVSRVKIVPSGGADDTPIIQAALDKVGKLDPGEHGERGAVELAPGTYHLAGTLLMHTAGVVLRGSGSDGAGASILSMTGTPHLAIEIKGDFLKHNLGPSTKLSDAYVPAGTNMIHVADASGIHSGDLLQIVKPVTPQWVHFMGMDHLVRDGKPEEWVRNDIRVLRRVASVEGKAVRLQVPLTDSFDAQFYGDDQPTVTRVEVTGQIAQIGVENLRFAAPDRSIDLNKDPRFDGIVMDNVVDSWLRGLKFVDTTDSVRIEHNAERLTVVDVDVHQNSAVTSHAKPADFSVNGSQILLDRCSATGDRVSYVVTQGHSQGPVVVLHCRFNGDGMVEGHQRWSTGLLVDSCSVPKGTINLRNRGIMGSGHGWANGWSVLWVDEAGAFLVQNPPGDMNWSIGGIGQQERASMPGEDRATAAPLPNGVIESQGKHVKPESLYLEQLRERLGPAAVAAVGYR